MLGSAIRQAAVSAANLTSSVLYRFSPEIQESRRRLKAYKNKHEGQRCIIIGNGPSLKKTNLSLLKNEITFGMNRIYLLFDSLGGLPTYYVAINKYVVEQCAEDISRLPFPKFINWNVHKRPAFSSDTIFIRTKYGKRFCPDIEREGFWPGGTVTYAAMQIAYYMGFKTVILIGVDHNFETKGKPNKLIVSQGSDPNHFDSRYFGKGFRWQLPDLETSEVAYRLALETFQAGGREIVDATVGGKLTVFPKGNLEDLVRKP